VGKQDFASPRSHHGARSMPPDSYPPYLHAPTPRGAAVFVEILKVPNQFLANSSGTKLVPRKRVAEGRGHACFWFPPPITFGGADKKKELHVKNFSPLGHFSPLEYFSPLGHFPNVRHDDVPHIEYLVAHLTTLHQTALIMFPQMGNEDTKWSNFSGLGRISNDLIKKYTCTRVKSQ
jgi:hypothetical protein